MKRLADLHMHSYYSDGLLPPEALAEQAKAAGCEVLSLTDHDTLAGVRQMNEAAARLRLTNISGIEISTFLRCEAHILGYNVNIDDPVFVGFVKELEQGRRERAYKILERLRGYRIDIDPDYFCGKVRGELSRSHIAQAMVALGYEPDVDTAFKKWMKEGCPGYVPIESRHPKSAIDAVHAAGGVAVLAHPMRLTLDDYDRKDFIRLLAGWGLDGLEAIYKQSSPETVRRFRNIADGLHLFVTCGADYHGGRGAITARPLPQSAARALGLDG